MDLIHKRGVFMLGELSSAAELDSQPYEVVQVSPQLCRFLVTDSSGAVRHTFYRRSCEPLPCSQARCHKFHPQIQIVDDPACDKQGRHTQG